MSITCDLAGFALRQLISGAADATGLTGLDGVARGVGLLLQHFIDHSRILDKALHRAIERAWMTLEIALAGDSWWARCKSLLTPADAKAFCRQVQDFLDASPLAGYTGHRPEFRQECLRQLRSARKAGLLTNGLLSSDEVLRQVGEFHRFVSPQTLLDAEWRAVESVAEQLQRTGFLRLAEFVAMRPPHGAPLLVIAVRYFFRREVEADPELSRGLTFAQIDDLGQAQEAGFAALADALAHHGQRLESLLGDVQAVVEQTHGAVLDIQAELLAQGDHHRDVYEAVIALQFKLDLLNRGLRPRDSLSIRSEAERQLVKRLVGRYRRLPEEQRRQLPALLNAIGKLEVAAGEFQAAERDFEAVAMQVADDAGRCEAHLNAYHAILERRHWGEALDELRRAITFGGERIAPFPIDKYEPERILGAGGFGVVFLCRNRFSKTRVVVKALHVDDLSRSLDAVFAEASALEQLDPPAVIRLRDCGCAGETGTAPYLVMDYFDGPTLEEYVRQQGPLPVVDCQGIALQMAAGLHAAHARGVLHRDVKPGNVLVRKGEAGWEVKLIDFGLALRAAVVRHTVSCSEAMSGTVLGNSIAGTIDYAAPEQMGRLPGVAAGPYSDVYGFARTCCFALFGTPHPGPKQWRQLNDSPLTDLLGDCLSEQPSERPRDFAVVLDRLPAPVIPAPRAAFESSPAHEPPHPEPKPVRLATGAVDEIEVSMAQHDDDAERNEPGSGSVDTVTDGGRVQDDDVSTLPAGGPDDRTPEGARESPPAVEDVAQSVPKEIEAESRGQHLDSAECYLDALLARVSCKTSFSQKVRTDLVALRQQLGLTAEVAKTIEREVLNGKTWDEAFGFTDEATEPTSSTLAPTGNPTSPVPTPGPDGTPPNGGEGGFLGISRRQWGMIASAICIVVFPVVMKSCKDSSKPKSTTDIIKELRQQDTNRRK